MCNKTFFYYFFQASEEVSKNLSSIRTMLYGSGDQEPHTEVVAQLAQEMYNSNMLQLLIHNLNKIDFEVSCFYFKFSLRYTLTVYSQILSLSHLVRVLLED